MAGRFAPRRCSTCWHQLQWCGCGVDELQLELRGFQLEERRAPLVDAKLFDELFSIGILVREN